ncbi:MAG: DUF6515 family protein [Vicinamibacteria bacterium]
MKKTTAFVAVFLMLLSPLEPLYAQARGRSRGSVAAASGGSYSRSGNTASWQGGGGRVSGSASATRTESGGTTSRQAQTRSGASREVTREVDQEDKTVERTSTATTAQGETATRERTTEAQGGYATVEGSASTSTGREAEGQGAAGRTYYGQPAVAGSVDTKYHGSYAVAAARNPGGGYTAATVGPYGGKVTTTLPSGYRRTSYHGRSYYDYGGAYYRPYMYHGVPYYYPVPVPYYTYYEQPPVGAVILMVAGVKYLMSKDGSYSKRTTDSNGNAAYQSVPAPQGAQIKTLPASRALVTVEGTTYYLYSNAFYRRVVQGTEEQFVVVSPPAGVVFLQALAPDFEVVQLNTMYFKAGAQYYVPYLSADGQELYVLVDTPPQPTASAPAQPTAPKPAAPAPEPAPAIRTVDETLTVPTGTLVLVRLQKDVSSETAKKGDRFQAFLDQDIAANGRMIVAKGAKVYGVVTEVDQGSKMKGKALLSVALTDLQVGGQVISIKTQPLQVQGQKSSGGKKLAGGAILGAAIGAIADGGEGAAIGAAVGAGAGGVAAAAGNVDPAVIPAQKLEAFTVGVPFQVHVMTNVAVRIE